MSLFCTISKANYFWNCIFIVNQTPLICASSHGYTEIVQLLLSQPNIEINHRDIAFYKAIMIFQFAFIIKFVLAFFVEFHCLTCIQLPLIGLQKTNIITLLRFYYKQIKTNRLVKMLRPS